MEGSSLHGASHRRFDFQSNANNYYEDFGVSLVRKYEHVMQPVLQVGLPRMGVKRSRSMRLKIVIVFAKKCYCVCGECGRRTVILKSRPKVR